MLIDGIKVRINSTSSWFSLHGYIEIHGQQNIKMYVAVFLNYVPICMRLGQHDSTLRSRKSARPGTKSIPSKYQVDSVVFNLNYGVVNFENWM